MKTAILSFLLALYVIFLQGCGVKQNVQSVSNLQQQEGLVVGTVRVEINGRDVTDKAGMFFNDKSFGTALKSLSTDGFFAFSFQEGTHEISMVNYYEGYPTVPIENKNVGYSFNVQAGKANYLGDILVKWVVSPHVLQEPSGSILKPKYRKYLGRDLGSVSIETSYHPEQITQKIIEKYGTSIEIVATEIAASGNPDEKDRHGYTALMHAAAEGSLNVGKDLIAKGADVNAVDSKEGHSALMYAILNDHVDFANLLLDNAADPNITSQKGAFPLGEAAYKGMSSTVQRLLEMGADIDKRFTNGLSAIYYAALAGDYETVKILIESGADVNIRS